MSLPFLASEHPSLLYQVFITICEVPSWYLLPLRLSFLQAHLWRYTWQSDQEKRVTSPVKYDSLTFSVLGIVNIIG
jgi:hypothetical protein